MKEKCFSQQVGAIKLDEQDFDPICVNRQTLETVNSVKLLGLDISSDLKWNVYVSK